MIKDRDTTVGYHCPYCGMSILNRINIFAMNGNLIKLKCVCGGSELIVQSLKEHKFRLTVPCILCPNTHSFTLSSSVFFRKDLFAFSCKFTAINICFIGKSNQVFEAMKINEEELMKTFAAYEEEYEGEFDENGDAYNAYLNGFDIFGEFDEFEDDDEFDGFGNLENDMDMNMEDPFKYEEKEPGFILHKTGDLKNNNFKVKPGASKKDEMNKDNINEQNSIKMQLQSYQITGQILDSLSKLCDRKKIFCQCGNFDGKIVLAGNAVHIECKNCGSYRDIKSTNAADADYLSETDELYLDFDD